MYRSWLVAGVSAAAIAFAYLLLSGLSADTWPHPPDFTTAGGLYTLAFAARLTV